MYALSFDADFLTVYYLEDRVKVFPGVGGGGAHPLCSGALGLRFFSGSGTSTITQINIDGCISGAGAAKEFFPSTHQVIFVLSGMSQQPKLLIEANLHFFVLVVVDDRRQPLVPRRTSHHLRKDQRAKEEVH
jgi:hypothetical protein